MRDPQTGHPRVLVVSSSVFNPYAGTGVTLSNLFRDWPSEELAMIHADESFEPDPEVCGRYYALSSRERRGLGVVSLARRLARLRRLFRWERLGDNGGHAQMGARRSRSHSRLLQLASRTLGDLEPLAPIRISSDLRRWIHDFAPAVVYGAVSNITYMRFVRRVVSLTDAALAIHTMDDWPSFAYENGLLGAIFRLIMRRELRRLFSVSDLRVGIGPAMCAEYESRYGHAFVPFSNPEDVDLWPVSSPTSGRASGPFEVLYVGTINSKNRQCLAMLANSVHNLHSRGKDIHLRILTFRPRVDMYRPSLQRLPSVTVSDAPGDLRDFRTLLMGADLLVMPLDFTEVAIARMRLSVFTKVPAYMLSGVPILMCGPLAIGVVEQARDEGWAYVVSEPVEDQMEAAIVELMHNQNLRIAVSATARRIAEERHSARVVRERLRSEICAAAQRKRQRRGADANVRGEGRRAYVR